MTQEEAMQYIYILLTGLQRARSVSQEGIAAEVVRISDEQRLRPAQEVQIYDTLADLTPWLHGRKGDALLNALVLVGNRGTVTGMEFYNFMTIIHRLEPFIAAAAGTLTNVTFPQPDSSW